jgi:prevent-host-death family protein
MKDRVVSATEFKARCLALLDEIDDRGGTITITRRGRPLAMLAPVKKRRLKSPEGAWIGKLRMRGDLASADTSGLWEVLRAIDQRRHRARFDSRDPV